MTYFAINNKLVNWKQIFYLYENANLLVDFPKIYVLIYIYKNMYFFYVINLFYLSTCVFLKGCGSGLRLTGSRWKPRDKVLIWIRTRKKPNPAADLK